MSGKASWPVTYLCGTEFLQNPTTKLLQQFAIAGFDGCRSEPRQIELRAPGLKLRLFELRLHAQSFEQLLF